MPNCPLPCLGLIVLAACRSGAARETWAGTMDTLSDGRVVVTNPAQGVWTAETGWRVVEELRIGAADGTGPEALGRLSVLAEDAGGRIWALESQDQVFKVFGADGGFIRTVGRKGGGPGELRQAGGVAWTRTGDLLVVDPQGARISYFDTAGTFLRSVPISGGYVMVPWPGGVDTAGYLYHIAPRPSVGAFEIGLVRYDSAMTPLDTLIPPRLERPEFFEHRGSGGGFLRSSVPYAPGLLWRLTRQGDLWFVHTGTYQLFRQSAAGDTIRAVTKPYQTVRVTDAEKDTAVARLSWFTRQGGTVDRGRIPDVKPAVEGLHVAEDGHLWVSPVQADTALQGRLFEIFDPEGRFLGALHLPFKLLSYPAPVLRPDRIIAVTESEDGVPFIVRARIAR